MYIPTQKHKSQLNEPYISIKWFAPGVKINQFLPLNIFFYLQYRSVFMYISETSPVLEILGKFHIYAWLCPSKIT